MLRSNVLIVDDSVSSRRTLMGMLEELYNVYEAKDGAEAIRLLEARPEFYQLILLNLNMPEMDGYGVLKVMRERGWLKEVPVVIISSEIGNANKLGAVDILSKPFDVDIVRTRISNVLAIYERYVLDSLTEGLNRKGFVRQVENFFQSGVDKTEYDILFFDVKNFKAVNELIDIKNGDKVLQHIYQRMVQGTFAPLAVARIEADHFVCLVKRENYNYESLNAFCQQEYEQSGKSFQVFIRCGVFQVPETSMSVLEMIERARMAESYESDDHNRYYHVYNAEMKTFYMDYAEVVSQLSASIKNQEFQVHFQPIMDINTGRIASAEALVRWEHPTKGRIPPASFIPILEQEGNISKLDMYVAKKVRAFQKKCLEEGISIVPISVNLSGMDFYDEEVMDRIIRFMDCDDVPNWAMRFEITETSYAAMGTRCKERIREMRKQDVEILLDDFGTGYSSLNLLQNMDVDVLKLDMSFVHQIDNNHKTRSILRAVIDTGHQLGSKIVAEGVETEEQFKFLQMCKCDYIQGYLFSKPLPEKEFVQRLKEDFRTYGKQPVKSDAVYIPYFYRVGVHYTSKQELYDTHVDAMLVTEMLKNNQAVGNLSGFFDEKQTICYICDFCLSIMNMTFEEFRAYTNDSYRALVSGEDRERYERFDSGICDYHLVLPSGECIAVRDFRTVSYTKEGRKQWISALRLLEEDA